MSDPPSAVKRIVIAGGGFSGGYCAAALEPLQRRRPDVEVVLIDRQNYFIFFPLLVEAGTGSLEPRHAVVPIRRFIKRGRFLMAEIVGADLARNLLFYRLSGDEPAGRRELPYDHLVVALGSVTRLPNVPGLAEHGFQMKSMADAVGLRDRAIQLLERASAEPDPAARRPLLNWVVVGANFTGVEVAGEFQEFLRRAARQYPNLSPRDCNVTLIERENRILSALDDDLADYAAAQMRKRAIGVELGRTVTRIDAASAQLDDGRTLETATVVWCAGIAPNPAVAPMGLPVDPRGYILCEPDQRVKGFDNVWAVGDGAVNTAPDGSVYPPTAQHAVQEGRHLASNLAAVLEGGQTTLCVARTQGSLAALGCRTGVAKVMGMKISGFWAWWLWRSVYLMKMPGWGRRIRIAMDWTADLLFGKDYVQLGLHERRRDR